MEGRLIERASEGSAVFGDITGCCRRFLYSVIGSLENWVMSEVGYFFRGNLGAIRTVVVPTA